MGCLFLVTGYKVHTMKTIIYLTMSILIAGGAVAIMSVYSTWLSRS